MRILTSTVGELTPKEYKTCGNLTMRRGGMMMYSLRDARKHIPEDAIAILALDGEEIVGWALLSPTWHEPNYDPLCAITFTRYAKRVCKYSAQFYVKASRRGDGIGKILLEEALWYSPRLHVMPWSDGSAALFASFEGVYTDGYRRYMIRNAKRLKAR